MADGSAGPPSYLELLAMLGQNERQIEGQIGVVTSCDWASTNFTASSNSLTFLIPLLSFSKGDLKINKYNLAPFVCSTK